MLNQEVSNIGVHVVALFLVSAVVECLEILHIVEVIQGVVLQVIWVVPE
jgi:hypothetical protein